MNNFYFWTIVYSENARYKICKNIQRRFTQTLSSMTSYYISRTERWQIVLIPKWYHTRKSIFIHISNQCITHCLRIFSQCIILLFQKGHIHLCVDLICVSERGDNLVMDKMTVINTSIYILVHYVRVRNEIKRPSRKHIKKTLFFANTWSCGENQIYLEPFLGLFEIKSQ